MTVIAIIILILLGIILLLLEFLIIPGITIAGIGGGLLMAGGIYLSYSFYGPIPGHITLVSTMIVVFITVYFSLRSGTWKKVMLHTSIDGTVDSISDKIKPGDMGITVTRLAPIGRVEIGDQQMEAKSVDQFIDPGTNVEVIKVLSTQVIVKPKK